MASGYMKNNLALYLLKKFFRLYQGVVITVINNEMAI
jgi:hypothetical protein